MKISLVSTLAIASILALSGCASLQLQREAATRPVTAQERVDALQADLKSEWDAAQIAYNSGFINDQQFEVIGTAYNIPQAAVNVAIVAAEANPANFEDALLEASKAIKAFRDRVPRKKPRP